MDKDIVKRLAIQVGFLDKQDTIDSPFIDDLTVFAQAIIAAYVAEQKPVGETLLCNSDDDLTVAIFNRDVVPIGAKLFTLETQQKEI